MRPTLVRATALIPHPSAPSQPSAILHSVIATPRLARPPCIPFFRDPAYTRSTRNLYRRLLRATYSYSTAPSGSQPTTSSAEDQKTGSEAAAGRLPDSALLPSHPRCGLVGIRTRLVRDWTKRKGWTSPRQTAAFLAEQEDLLARLTSTSNDPHFRSATASNGELLDLDRAYHLSHTRRLARLAYSREQKASTPAPRAHLTGGFLRPSTFNPPLPRLRPQPIGISMMMRSRVRARERKQERRLEYFEYVQDIRGELELWKHLGLAGGREQPGAEWEGSGWYNGCKELLSTCEQRSGEEARRKMIYRPGMIRRVKAAKVRAVQWKRDQAEKRKVAETQA